MQILTFELLASETNPCSNFSIRITTDKDTDVVFAAENTSSSQIIGDEQILPNRRDFTITIPRNSIFSSIKVGHNNGNEFEFDSLFLYFIPFWEAQAPFVNPSINNFAVVNAKTLINSGFLFDPETLGFEYRLNSGSWQTSSTFLNVPVDQTYTMDIRDSFGCEKSIQFTVNALLPTLDPYFFISKLNPVFFALINELRPNPNNQLSYQYKSDTNFKDFSYQLWNEFPYTFQFRSNYETNQVRVTDCDGVEISLFVQKKSNNIGVVDIRDGILLPPTSEIPFVQLEFEGGNVYNPDDDTQVMGDSTLFGSLLQYHVVGSYVEVIGEGVFQILEIVETENGRKAVLNWESDIETAINEKIKTLFNANNYEVYEFTIPEGFDAGKYQISIIAYNGTREVIKAVSEQFEITNELAENHHVLKWKNNANNQITWETGIECVTCLPYNEIPTFTPESEDEVFMTDIAPRLLESELNEIFTFHFGLLPTNVARQIAFIISNDYLEIDGELYTKQETPEIEAQNGSNNCIVTVPLLLSTTFNSNERRGISDINTNVGGYLNVNDSGFLEID